MIKHIVFWRLYGEKEGFDKKNSIKLFLSELMKLPEQIEVIKSFSAGSNIIEGNEASDIVLEVTFDNTNDLKTYQKHPAHLAFIEKIKDLRYERRVVDYMI
jgi:hypothetical protein